MKEVMVNERDSSYVLRAKTGWAIRNGNNYGWFVGWVEKEGNSVYFATLVEPGDQKKVTDFTAARKSVTMEVLKALEIIQ
jgi:beta-lactamase class D